MNTRAIKYTHAELLKQSLFFIFGPFLQEPGWLQTSIFRGDTPLRKIP